MKVLQINSVANSGSTGRIAEEIGNVLIAHGHKSYVAYARNEATSNSHLIKIGNPWDIYSHGAYTLLTDKHGLASKQATNNFLNKVRQIQPDLVALHNLHGYYINIKLLFDYLKANNIPVVWTLFDCWSFTGHCTYFDDINCKKWKTQCHTCPKKKVYPKSFVDNSKSNFDLKKRLFTSLKRMEIITHSKWLSGLVQDSFLSDIKTHVTPSGINLELFKPRESNLKEKHKISDKKILLGCANIWSERKGLADFLKLADRIDKSYQIVLIGLSPKQIKSLPSTNILGLTRTESIDELAQWYTLATVFINPTYQDNFPTTNIEALACGTPVITYNTGGSPEAIDAETGIVVGKGDVIGIEKAIKSIESKDQKELSNKCIARAQKHYDKEKRYLDYLNIFENMVQN